MTSLMEVKRLTAVFRTRTRTRKSKNKKKQCEEAGLDYMRVGRLTRQQVKPIKPGGETSVKLDESTPGKSTK